MNNYPVPESVEDSLKPKTVVPSRARDILLGMAASDTSEMLSRNGQGWDAPDAWSQVAPHLIRVPPALGSSQPISPISPFHRFKLRNTTDHDRRVELSSIVESEDERWQELVSGLKINSSLRIGCMRFQYKSYEEMDRNDPFELTQINGFGNKMSINVYPKEYSDPFPGYLPQVERDINHVISMGFSIATMVKAKSEVTVTFFYSAIQR